MSTIRKSILILGLLFMQTVLYGNRTVQKGFADLSGWNFEKQGYVKLQGEWEFFWKKLIPPADFTTKQLTPDFLIDQPRSWADVYNTPVKPTELGYATYHVKVKIPARFIRDQVMLGIKVLECHTSCYVWINGHMIIRNGTVSTSKETYIPKYHPTYEGFISSSDTLDIVVQAANFLDNNQGGLDDEVMIGTYDQIRDTSDNMNMIHIFSFGILLIMALYHFLLYWFRRSEKYNLYFMLACISLALMSLSIGERTMFLLFPDIPVVLFMKIWYSTVACVGFMNLFLYYFFPGSISKLTIRLISIFYILNTLLAFILPVSGYTVIINYMLLIVLISFLYLFWVSFKCLLEKRPFSTLVFVGLLIPIIVGANDILFAMDLIVTGYYGPIGYLAYVFTQSIIISYKFSTSYKQVESLTRELESSNLVLEQKVKDRTQELATTNEELKNLVATKDKFISVITHDLRNSFQALKNLSDNLSESVRRKEQENITDLAEWISKASAQTNKLLENLVEWSRIQSGKMAFTPECFNLHNLSQDILQMFAYSLTQKNISLSSEISKHQMVYADYNMLFLIMRNLMSNAVKFTEKGGKIKISSRIEKDEIIISVIDNGIGISHGRQNTLFMIEKAYSTSGTENEKGSGLGLLLCYECVLKHNGKIVVDSEPGKGTAFHIWLPGQAVSK